MRAFYQRLRESGLEHRIEAVEQLARLSIRIRPRPGAPAPAVGGSRIGGLPDLARASDWPSFHGTPLAFLAQIDLREVSPFAAAAPLPRDGWLQFFYEVERGAWGFDPADRGSFLVRHVASSETLHRPDPPLALPEGAAFAPLALHFTEEMTWPSWESADFESLGLTDEEVDRYLEALDASEAGATSHRLLGHADPIQGDMQLECQLVSHGIDVGQGWDTSSPLAQEVAKGARDWRLLLQLDSDEGTGMMWGDAGRLYFWITEASLAERRFEECWMVLQCS
jgi:uncharacterized protein YwqG